MLYNVSYRIVKNEFDAQDMVHDAIIKAFQTISNTPCDLNLGPWLKRIVINCSLDHLRQRKKLGWLKEPFEFSEFEDEQVTYQDITLKVEHIKEGIYDLKDKYRIILVLYLIEDYSHREIAAQLGLKEGTVRNQYIRGKRLLKQRLQNVTAL